MYELSQLEIAKSPRITREFSFPSRDTETLVVDFLSELLFVAEDEQLAFDTFYLSEEENILNAKLEGSDILTREKEIKAVTFHNMNVERNGHDLQVEVVFDV